MFILRTIATSVHIASVMMRQPARESQKNNISNQIFNEANHYVNMWLGEN